MKLVDFIVEKDDSGDNEEEKCRGCGKAEVVMKGLCKECAEDTYADKD